MNKGYLLLVFAILLDTLQLFVSLALLAGGPVGIFFGVIINLCLSLSFGMTLIALLIYSGYFRLRPVGVALLGEIIPLIDNGPMWSLMVWRCITKTSAAGTKTGFAALGQATTGGMTGGIASLGKGMATSALSSFGGNTPQRQGSSENQTNGGKEGRVRSPLINTRQSDIRPRTASGNSPQSISKGAANDNSARLSKNAA